MSEVYFDTVNKKVGDWLVSQGFTLSKCSKEDDADKFARYLNGDTAVQVQYADKKFSISRSLDGGENFDVLQVYLFDADAGDDERQATSIANEFVETLDTKPKAIVQKSQSAQSSSKKESDSDETGSVFFVNRFPTVLPEVKAPLIAHKEHYGQLLPNTFCEECVNTAIENLVKEGDKEKLQKVMDFLENMYKNGDSDVKSIITMTILNSIKNSDAIEMTEGLLGPELKKIWPAARKLIGKTFKPERQTMSQKFFNSISEGKNTNGLR